MPCMKVHFMSSAWNLFHSSYSFLFLKQKIKQMAHKACSKAQKVVRMSLIPFNISFIALRATEAGKTFLVGQKQVWIFPSSKRTIYDKQNVLSKLAEVAILLALLDTCPAHNWDDRTIVLTEVFLTIPFNKTEMNKYNIKIHTVFTRI